jgi:hypothetical protein
MIMRHEGTEQCDFCGEYMSLGNAPEVVNGTLVCSEGCKAEYVNALDEANEQWDREEEEEAQEDRYYNSDAFLRGYFE